ncbi:hypothetical protein [Georgenia sp. SYP-B2076]|uniref:hypothetical protein n=1 Tax=Georgenia sp. SYP-B2076 TaxID=2495881 RepID=UPI000F8E8EC7|nr:hypothetical protein [Georgenia sp. SYP-B2076]
MYHLRRSLVLPALAVLALAGCAAGGGGGAADAPASAASEEAENPMTPTDEPLGISPTRPTGDAVDPVKGLTLTLPGGTEEESSKEESGLTTVVYRLPGGDAASGLPVIQVQSDDGGRDLTEETYTQQQALVGAGINSDVHRSAETWPGAAEAMALTWTQAVEEDGGGSHANDVFWLWLVDEQGRGYNVMAVAPEGELEPGSETYDAVLSATLG